MLSQLSLTLASLITVAMVTLATSSALTQMNVIV